MAFGDVAREALKRALEVYEGLVKLSAVVEQIQARVTDLRDEMRKRQLDFEQRVEARFEGRLREIEARMRELESRMSKVEAKAEGALAEAYRAILQKYMELGVSTATQLEAGHHDKR